PNLLELSVASCLAIIAALWIQKAQKEAASVYHTIPGPWYAPWTSIHLMYLYYFGHAWKVHEGMHAKYGPIYRLGPRQIFISDKEAIRKLLVIDDLRKTSVYSAVARQPEEAGLVFTSDKDRHRDLRRLMSPFFSIKNLASLEDRFAWALRNLIDEYDRAVQASPGDKMTDRAITVDLYNDAARMAYDIIGTTGFGQDFHLLDPNAKDSEDAMRFVKIPYQGTKWFVQRFGLAFFKPIRFLFPLDTDLFHTLEDLVSQRQNLIRDDPQSAADSKDLLQCMLTGKMKATTPPRAAPAKDGSRPLERREVVSQGVELLLAGAETTSNTITYCLMTLLKHPEKLKVLQDSIPSVPIDAELPSHTACRENELPLWKPSQYLDACIKETMRLFPVTGELGRTTSREPATFMGHVFPPRTAISASLRTVHRRPDYWQRPDEYIPERWLSDAQERGIKPADTSAYFPFSAGTRNCIGMNFAWQEMRITITTLLARFYISEVPKQKLEFRQFVTFQLKLGTGYQVKLTPREA
ncbi:cytochrome P450, partial [Ceraceosorus guamensis]